MKNSIEEILLFATNSSEIINIELIQELWSGHGQLSRVRLKNKKSQKSVILKFIQPPQENSHPHAWNTNFSHQRKIKSYQVEMNWYEQYNRPVKSAYSPFLIEKGENSDFSWLILDDLKTSNFTPKHSINWSEVKLCLKWLAKFHANYLGQNPKGLWEIGSYWHLETRPDELDALEDLELKKAAPLIDKKLNSAQFKTFLHGDAKLANFLFNEEAAAAVDFQYVGGGVGIKDVAYFLSSIYNEDELLEKDEICLDYYFQELNNKEVEKEWRELYPYAWCDFYRFLLGWSPTHFKLNTYSKQMKDKALSWI